MAAHGERIQQRLCRMLVRPVAGVDHASLDPAGGGQPVRSAGAAVPDHDAVGAHRLEGQRGVLETLALGHAGALRREVDDVGGEPLRCGLERDPSTGGVLEKQVHHRPSPQSRKLLDGAVGQLAHLLGSVKNEVRLVPVEIGGREEVALHRAVLFTEALLAGRISALTWSPASAPGGGPSMTTSSSPSSSASRTRTVSR